jgi:hypothetical protein
LWEIDCYLLLYQREIPMISIGEIPMISRSTHPNWHRRIGGNTFSTSDL